MARLTFISNRYYFVQNLLHILSIIILWNLVASQVVFKIVTIRLGHIACIFRFVDKKFLKFLCHTGTCKAYSWSIDVLFVHPWGESIIFICNTWHSWATCKIFILYLCFCVWRNGYIFIFLNKKVIKLSNSRPIRYNLYDFHASQLSCLTKSKKVMYLSFYVCMLVNLFD